MTALPNNNTLQLASRELAADRSATAAAIAQTVRDDLAAGKPKTWRSITGLLDAFRESALTDAAARTVTEALAAAGVRVQPALTEVSRQDKVRLLLPDHPGVHNARGAEDLVTVTVWRTGQPPQYCSLSDFAGELAAEAQLWVNIAPDAETHSVFALLEPILPGLSVEALDDLLHVDDVPAAAEYGAVHKMSSVAVFADEPAISDPDVPPSKAGTLAFETVEMITAKGWLITCWHDVRRYQVREVAVEPARGRETVLAAVANCWPTQSAPTAATLGLLILRELARTYARARRTLYSWLEQWDLDFQRTGASTESETLHDLRVLVSEFHRRMNSLYEARMVVGEQGWMPDTVGTELDDQVMAVVERALDDLVGLATMLRSAVELLTTAGIREHLRLAEEQTRRGGHFQDQIALVTSALLVPTFFAGLFGANTEIPGQGHWSGFVLMVALMMLGGAATMWFFRRARPGSAED